jgi:hypothetical protein
MMLASMAEREQFRAKLKIIRRDIRRRMCSADFVYIRLVSGDARRGEVFA